MIMQRLSLLARGTLTHHIRVRPRDRLIPAGAGNTTTHQDRYTPRPVYPRWRGEHPDNSDTCKFCAGLSPLARGTQQTQWQRRCSFRFIPAGAGNTLSNLNGSGFASVYPRWRGEHACAAFRNRLKRRFIPAGAGNTHSRSQAHFAYPVYPRWRGEHPTTNRGHKKSRGLSPLARGTRKLSACRLVADRFIPAGAGNTGVLVAGAIAVAVYPRWRGEHDLKLGLIDLKHGLSPLARGTPLRFLAIHRQARFIPAGAGNTR